MLQQKLIARLDTTSVSREVPTVALVIVNETAQPFAGVAQLTADFRTRAVAPVSVFDVEGNPVPCRVLNETVGAVEADGKRRWAFVLEYFANCPAQSAIAYGATFGETPPPPADWDARHAAGVLIATETTCHPGDLPNPCHLRDIAPDEH